MAASNYSLHSGFLFPLVFCLSSLKTRKILINFWVHILPLQVLVVQEKHTAPALTGLWKLPTGFIQEVCFFNIWTSISARCIYYLVLFSFLYYLQSEEIFTGAVREVKEETGVRTSYIVPLNIYQLSLVVCIHELLLIFYILQIDTEFIEVVAFRYRKISASSEVILITHYLAKLYLLKPKKFLLD